MRLQALTETFLRSRNRIASGFIVYQLFHQQRPLKGLITTHQLIFFSIDNPRVMIEIGIHVLYQTGQMQVV